VSKGLTEAQKGLLIASQQSKEFFFENFYMVPDIQAGGLRPLRLRDYQKQILADIEVHTNIVGLKARQIGWTTIAVANALHDVLFNEWRPWTFISRNEKAAQDMVGKAITAYYRLPGWMRRALPSLKAETQGSLVFSNGSRIVSEPATASSFRGDAVYGLLMDECAFMEYAEEIWGAAEAGVYGPRMLFSTANGMGNFFHDIWLDSQKEDSVWHGIFYPWNVVPSRDEQWYDLKKRGYRGREWLFYQEYPSTPEEAFAKSGRVAFQADLVSQVFEEIEPEARYSWTIGGTATPIGPNDDADIVINMWRKPFIREDEHGRMLVKPNYVVGVDVAEGLEHGDFSYITVFDAINNEQVASCKTHMPVHYLSEVVEWLAYEYYQALIIIERNAAGLVPIGQIAIDHWYPRMYRMDRFATMPTNVDRTPEYGWRTSAKTKPKMVLDMQSAIADGDIILHDPEFCLEAQTFIADGRGSYAATSGNHDDVIMGTLIAWQGVLDSAQYPVTWRDKKIRPLSHEELDSVFFPPGEPDDPLNNPIGQVKREKAEKSFVLLPGNLRRSPFAEDEQFDL